MKNVELMGVLKVVEDDGTITIIEEGDYVICLIGDNEYYIGTVFAIGHWNDNENETKKDAIGVLGKFGKTVLSYNIVLLSDIKWIHKMSDEDKKEFEGVFKNKIKLYD